jgi:hypothetical protein
MSDTTEGARKVLVDMGYKNATVTEYTPAPTTKKPVSVADIRKAIANGTLSKDDAKVMLEEILEA